MPDIFSDLEAAEQSWETVAPLIKDVLPETGMAIKAEKVFEEQIIPVSAIKKRRAELGVENAALATREQRPSLATVNGLCRKTNGQIEKVRKFLVEDAVRVQKVVNGLAKKTKEEVALIQKPILDRFAEWDAEDEAAAQAEREAAEAAERAVREAEQAAIAAEQAKVAEANRVDAERLRAEREAFMAEQAERDAARARQKKIDDDQRQAENMARSEIMGIQQQLIIAQAGRSGVRRGGTIECIEQTLAETEKWEITGEKFGGLTGVAQLTKVSVVDQIKQLLVTAHTNAAAEVKRLAQQKIADDLREFDRVQAQKVADELAEFKRLKAEAEAAEKAKADAEVAEKQRIALEEAERFQAQQAAEKERLRLEAIEPDIPKLRRLAAAIDLTRATANFELVSDDAKATVARAINDMKNIAAYLLEFGTK